MTQNMYVKMMQNKIDVFVKKFEFDKERKMDEKFELFVSSLLLKETGANSYKIQKGIVDGGRDEGIDSIFLLINGEIVDDIDIIKERIHSDSKIRFIFIQSKTSTKFEEDAINRLYMGLRLIFEEQKLQNERLLERATLIREAWKSWFVLTRREPIEVEIHYATLSNNNELACQNESFSNRVEKIYDFFHSIDLKCKEFRYMGCRELDNLHRKLNNYSKSLNIVDSFKCREETVGAEYGFVCLVKGLDYYDFITDEHNQVNDSIFEENIRDFQGTDNSVNDSIVKTIVKGEQENFWCYNNGITIIAESGSRTKGQINITNYQIINGCQTSYSIADALTGLPEGERLTRDFELIIKVIVINSSKEDEIINIIQRTNSQTKIENYAFESYRNVHKKIEDFFKNQLTNPYYYERRVGYYKRRDYNIDRIVTPKSLLQEVYAIFYAAPSIARNSVSSIFDSFKEEVFSDEVNLEIYFICHEIAQLVRKSIPEYSKGMDKKDSFIVNNLSLHISRCVFSLILKKEIKAFNYMNQKDLSKRLGQDIFGLLDSESIQIDEYLEQAIKILRLVLDYISKENRSTDLSALIKKSDFDSSITRFIARYLQAGNFEELKEEIKIKDSQIQIINSHMTLSRVFKDYNRKFKKISSDGDLRYNFFERVMDVANSVEYYYKFTDVSIYHNKLLDIAREQDSKENSYENRRKYANEILTIIDEIQKKMDAHK